MRNNYKEIETAGKLNIVLKQSGGIVEHCALQSVNMYDSPDADKVKYHDCLFMGCRIPDSVSVVIDNTCIVFPKIDVPYITFPNGLYNSSILYKGYDYHDESTFETCYDTKIYKHYIGFGKRGKDIKETLARSLHDHSITNALYDMLEGYDEKMVVGVMGGHARRRVEPEYRQVAQIAKKLTEMHRLMVTGGGPGAMEATHLGAWMAGRTDEELDEAVEWLKQAPTFRDAGWLRTSFEVMERYPQQSGYRSLSIPTWFYGHEPSTPFATDIAKYFDNSVREDGIVTIAKGGIIYTPGSAGTLQEIFQDAGQNHYETEGYASPMVFMGKDYYTKQIPVYTMLCDLAERGVMKNMLLTISDDNDEIINALVKFNGEMA